MGDRRKSRKPAKFTRSIKSSRTVKSSKPRKTPSLEQDTKNEYELLVPEDIEEDIAAGELATATAHVLAAGQNGEGTNIGDGGASAVSSSFGTVSSNFVTRRKKRRSRKFGQSRKFSQSFQDQHLANFLTIAVMLALRGYFKGSMKESVNFDLLWLEKESIETLQINSLINILNKVIGPENTGNLLLMYNMYKIAHAVHSVGKEIGRISQSE